MTLYTQYMEKAANRLTRFIAANRSSFPEERLTALEHAGALKPLADRVPGMQFGTRKLIQQVADKEGLQVRNWKGTTDPLTAKLTAIPERGEGAYYQPGENSHPYQTRKDTPRDKGVLHVVRGESPMSVYASAPGVHPSGRKEVVLKIPEERRTGNAYSDAMSDVVSRHETSETKYALPLLGPGGRTSPGVIEQMGSKGGKDMMRMIHPLGLVGLQRGTSRLVSIESGLYSHISPHVLREESNHISAMPHAHLGTPWSSKTIDQLYDLRHLPSGDQVSGVAQPSEASFVQAATGKAYGAGHIPARTMRRLRNYKRDDHYTVFNK